MAKNAIVFLLLSIGIGYYSYSEIAIMLDNSIKDIIKKISLVTLNPDSVGHEAFYLTDFYFDQNDFNRLNNKNFFLLLYGDESDSIARIGIEVKDKSSFKESFTMNRRILVDANGSTYQVDIKGKPALFGYRDLFSNKDIKTTLDIDQSIKSRSITLKYIPEKSFSKNWLEIIFLIILPISFLILGFVLLKKAIRQGEF